MQVWNILSNSVRAYLTPGGAPLRVTHEVTHRCNLRCSFCGYWHDEVDGELEVDAIKHLMDQFVELGAVSWGFTGGEPLVKPGIDELIAHGTKRGLYLNMVSNGTLIPWHLSALRQLAFVVISVDGPAELHDRMRGAGTFERTLEGIRQARKAGIPVVIQSILSGELCREKNHAGLLALVALAQEQQCRIMFQRLYADPFLPGPEVSSLSASDPDFKGAMDTVQHLRTARPRLFYQSMDELVYMREGTAADAMCFAGRYYCLLTPQGHLSPCIYKRNRAIAVTGDGVKGLRLAFDQMEKRHACRCFNTCYNRYNHLFQFNLPSMWRTSCDYFQQ